MSRFSAASIIKNALSGNKNWKPQWPNAEPKAEYDVIIVGAGGHGLGAAYYLAKEHGITNVAVIEKGWLGGGNTGRNTTIIRSNYLYDESAHLYEHAMKLWEGLSQDLNYNVMFSQRGVMMLAHTVHDVQSFKRHIHANRLNGIDNEWLTKEQAKEYCPPLDISPTARYPVVGATLQRRGGVARHDAVAWGYARGADMRGTHIHQNTEVTGIETENGRVMGVQTTRGRIKTGIVVNQTAGFCTLISDMVGVRLPITSHQLQACVTEALKPFLDVVIVSGSLHVYVSQADRGELVMGASIDPYTSYSMDSTLGFLENLCQHMLELFPFLSRVKILRQWAGVCDMTPDFSPIMGFTPVDGFLVDVGWGTYGFKAGPVSGKRMAELIATQQTPDLLAPFRLSRFADGALMGEKGAASVGH